MTAVIIPATPASGSPPLPMTVSTPLSNYGLLNPTLTMQTKDQPYYIPYYYLSSLQKQDPLTVSTLNAQTVNAITVNSVSTFAQNVLTNYIEATESYVYDKFTLDNQVLTANATELLLNGNPLVTANQISSIADWSKDPAISTIQANGNDLTNVRFANFSSIIADGLTVVKLTTLFSTTVEVFESTITAEIHKLTVSSITGGNGYFDVLTAGSIINPSASTINCQYLNVSSNANMLNATFSNAPTFNQGGTFNGTRPNFNTGINTSGANNFNFTNIDNASNINGNVITINPQNNLNINTSNGVATVVDRGSDVGGSAVIGLTAQYGAGSQINLNAKTASIYSPTPASAINLDAQGNVSYLSGIPFGGAVNISARAGLSGTGTSIAGGGGINLTAYSYGALAPGTIKESAGSILSYSGLTVPSVGVLGSGFYSALNCLSLTAGASPATTSYPGVVYLRGDNGTKVVNGFYADTITATGNSVLPTITGVTAINGVSYPPSSGSGVWCSTATTALNMNGFNIFAGSTQTLSIGTNTSPAPNNITFSNYGGTLGDVKINAYNITIGDSENGTVAINSGANGYAFINSGNIVLNGAVGINQTYPVGELHVKTAGDAIVNGAGWTKDWVLITPAPNSGTPANTPALGLGYNNTTGLATIASLAPNVGWRDLQLQAGNIILTPNNGGTVIATDKLDMTGHDVYNVNNLSLNNGTIYNAHELYNNNTDLLLTGITKNIILQTNSGGSIYLNNSGANVSLNTDGSMYLQTTGTNKTVYVNTESMYFSGSSNNNINGLGHIYGNTSAPGGGLAIDYMYGMFFNSAGHNANLFCDTGALRMLNYNTAIDINAVNSDTYIGAGHGIYLNATSNIALNVGGAQIAIATDSNIYFTGNGTSKFANFQDTNVAFNSGTPGSLSMYMNSHNIRNVGELTRNLGSAVVAQPVIQHGTDGTGSGPSGSVTVTIPNAYTSKTTYTVQVTMRDAPAAQLYATPISGNTFTIGWTSAGTGTQNIMWVTFGT
jgi:hypothetical protein